MNSPRDILNYILENNLEFDFMNSLSYHVQNFSIGEITDREYVKTEKGFKLRSKTYKINIEITDDDVLTALHNELYVSSFISRFGDKYNVHFLVHQCPVTMKSKFDERIAEEVIQYMIYNTVIALRLDTTEKVDNYLKR